MTPKHTAQPDVTVAAIVFDNGRFLCVEERIRQQLVINQPAGHVEDRETLIEAVTRETLEETAWRFHPEALVGTYLWRNPRTGGSTLRFSFCGTVSDHDAARRLDRPVERATWFTRDELISRSGKLRSPMVLRCIDDYLAGMRLPLDSVAYLDLRTAPQIQAVNL